MHWIGCSCTYGHQYRMVNLLYSQLYSEEGLILYTCFDICTKISLVSQGCTWLNRLRLHISLCNLIFPHKITKYVLFFLQITICLIPKLWLKNQVKPNYLHKSSFICQQCKILNVRNVLVKHDRHKLDLSLTLWGHGIYLVLVSHLHAEQVVKP